ncbi:hypothetical protein [Andreprevotia chitinilytica]|uniref:hypothetical protein n=1 Tax=Andreprevotia chitinilytica TaxID=396808 RepID=UPI0012EB7340|nr:hypothetical protein [Andreprevotia chitinilytica]
MHNEVDFLSWINDLTPAGAPAASQENRDTSDTTAMVCVTKKTFNNQSCDTRNTSDTPNTLPPNLTTLAASPQEIPRAADLTAEAWALWREIALQVAEHDDYSTADRSWLMRRLAEQDASLMRALLQQVRHHVLPITDRFEFWQLAYPGQYILRIVTPTHACFIALPADHPSADLFHGATVTMG